MPPIAIDTLRARPCVALAITDHDDPVAVAGAAEAGIDLLELRVDRFADRRPAAVQAYIGALPPVPRLLTVRMQAEGGDWPEDEATRLACYEALLPAVDAVDVELAAPELLRALVPRCREAHKPLVGSHHDFAATPDAARWERLKQEAAALEVDVLKLAAHCGTRADLQRLAGYLLDAPEQPKIVVGMGPYGTASRIAFPLLGSLLTYTFLETPSAPGQLNWRETLAYLKGLAPPEA